MKGGAYARRDHMDIPPCLRFAFASMKGGAYARRDVARFAAGPESEVEPR